MGARLRTARWFAVAAVLLCPYTAIAHEDHSSIELGGTLSGAWAGPGQPRLASFELPVRYFVFDGADLGLEARYWPAGAYPLSSNVSSVLAGGANGRIFFVNRDRLGAYVGGALLWAPASSQAILGPEVGVRYFVSRKVAVGASYDIVTDLGSFLLSLQPQTASGSCQSLGVSLAVEL